MNQIFIWEKISKYRILSNSTISKIKKYIMKMDIYHFNTTKYMIFSNSNIMIKDINKIVK